MDERGGAVNVEMALLWGAMTLLTLAVVQVALVFYAGQLALTAAEDGLRTGGGYGSGSATEARRAAETFLQRAAGTTLTGTSVTATIDPAAGVVRVRVAGSAPSLVPGLSVPVAREAVGGLERVMS